YFEGRGAGEFHVSGAAGAMHRIDGGGAHLRLLQFGFDLERLFVRIDAHEPVADLLAGGLDVALTFLAPAGVRFVVTAAGGRLAESFWVRSSGTGAWTRDGARGARAAAGTILELAVPGAALGLSAGHAAG